MLFFCFPEKTIFYHFWSFLSYYINILNFVLRCGIGGHKTKFKFNESVLIFYIMSKYIKHFFCFFVVDFRKWTKKCKKQLFKKEEIHSKSLTILFLWYWNFFQLPYSYFQQWQRQKGKEVNIETSKSQKQILTKKNLYKLFMFLCTKISNLEVTVTSWGIRKYT